MLNENKHLGGQASGVTLVQLKQAIDFYENEISKIKDEEININRRIESKKADKSKLERQLKELNEKGSLPASEIEITVSADQQVTTTIAINYLVANAGWYPKYDVRVEDIKSPLLLTFKAEVFQNTGVDWKNVRLRFSNANPNQTGLVPELSPWGLTYSGYTSPQNSVYGLRIGSVQNVRGIITDETGSPIPGVNVIVKGTTIGTVTDVNGNYRLTLPNNATTLVVSFVGYSAQEVAISKPEINLKLQPDVMMLSEVVAAGYTTRRSITGSVAAVRVRGVGSINTNSNIIPTSIIENQTTVEFEVLTPYSIRSNGEKLLVDLKTYDIPAQYEYYGIPKLEKDAFLIARIINWDQYNLIQGEANLYFEDAYVGRSILNARALEDTLSISLGRDKNIVISRERKEQFLKKKVIGSNVVDTRAFAITVRNKKSQSIKLTILDQVPVPLISDISVSVELSKGEFEIQTGKIRWQIDLDPKQQKEIHFEYDVKYPKKEKVILE